MFVQARAWSLPIPLVAGAAYAPPPSPRADVLAAGKRGVARDTRRSRCAAMPTARAAGHTTKVQCPGHGRPSRLGDAPCPCGSPRPSDLGPCASGLPVCLLPTSTARRPGGRGTPRASRAIAPGGPGRLESSWGLIPMQGGLKTFPGSPRSRADGSGRQSADPLSWRRPSQRLTDAMDGSGDEPAIDTGASQRRVGCHPSGRSQGPEPDPRGPKAPIP